MVSSFQHGLGQKPSLVNLADFKGQSRSSYSKDCLIWSSFLYTRPGNSTCSRSQAYELNVHELDEKLITHQQAVFRSSRQHVYRKRCHWKGLWQTDHGQQWYEIESRLPQTKIRRPSLLQQLNPADVWRIHIQRIQCCNSRSKLE